MEAIDHSNVNDNIINFRLLVKLVFNGQFVQTLPLVFTMTASKEDESGGSPPYKKQRKERGGRETKREP